jgi:hypothetical protein
MFPFPQGTADLVRGRSVAWSDPPDRLPRLLATMSILSAPKATNCWFSQFSNTGVTVRFALIWILGLAAAVL